MHQLARTRHLWFVHCREFFFVYNCPHKESHTNVDISPKITQKKLLKTVLFCLLGLTIVESKHAFQSHHCCRVQSWTHSTLTTIGIQDNAVLFIHCKQCGRPTSCTIHISRTMQAPVSCLSTFRTLLSGRAFKHQHLGFRQSGH